MKHRILNFSIARPTAVYWLTGLLTLLIGAQMLRINIDTDPENMLPAEQSDRVFHNQVEQMFSLHDAIVVGLVNEQHPDGIYNAASLDALHQLSNAILKIDGVIRPDLMSLAEADNISQGEAGALRFEWMMKDAPATDEQALAIRDDGAAPAVAEQHAGIRRRQGGRHLRADRQQRSQLPHLHGDPGAGRLPLAARNDYHITGLPVAEDTFGVEMFVQMGISAPLAGVMIFLLMWYFFRSWRLIIAPMIVAMVTVIVTMGLLIGMGFTVHIMSSMIPDLPDAHRGGRFGPHHVRVRRPL